MRTRSKLALLSASAVIIAIAAAALAFNLFVRAKVEGDALAAIEEAEGWETDEITVRTANYLLLDDSLSLDGHDASGASWYTVEEQAIVATLAKDPVLGEVRCIHQDGWMAYAELIEDVWHEQPYAYGRHEGATSYAVVYVDVSDEVALLHTLNLAFALIGAVGAVGAAYAARLAGTRIEAADEARTHFYENMSHELKTPVAAIRGYAEGIEAGVVEPDDAARAIVRETNRSSELIEGILGLARIDAGAVQLNRETVEVADLVQDCLMPFEGLVRTRGLDVQLELGPGSIEADVALLGHALENVFSNAVRHAATCVRVSCDAHELCVWNDGTEDSLPTPQELEGLFERYRTGSGGSTGIGLALAHEIVALHGWQLTAALEDGGLRMAMRFA